MKWRPWFSPCDKAAGISGQMTWTEFRNMLDHIRRRLSRPGRHRRAADEPKTRSAKPDRETQNQPQKQIMNPPVKNPFASKTIWGALLVILGMVSKLLGFHFPTEAAQSLIDLLAAWWPNIVEFAGALLAIWGRFTAKQPIRIQ